MVTKEKIISNVMFRHRVGTLLVWLGVFTWMPFIFLRAIGERPPFLLFLPFHLLGVIGGSRLRAMTRKDLGIEPPRKSPLLIAGHVLIFLGIFSWVPYLYLKLVMGQPVEVMNYLPFHLIGVLGGVFLHVLSYVLEHYGQHKV